MRNDLTELVFIIDRSGSMHGLEADTIGGFNAVLEKNRAVKGDANVTTLLFSSDVRFLHDRVPLEQVRNMTAQDYSVGGCTALLDAIGTGITRMIRVQRVAGEARAERVQFIIITDGYENASREFSLSQIRQMISRQRAEYDWDFVFLGADMDAVAAAAQMGISADRALSPAHDSQGVCAQFQSLADVTIEERCRPKNAARGTGWRAAVDADNARRNR